MDDNPSIQLIQVLRTYCQGLDPGGTSDLRYSVSTGHYPWLRAELTAALCGPDPSGDWWRQAIGDTPAGNHGSAQRRLWHMLFPADPYPQNLRQRVAHQG